MISLDNIPKSERTKELEDKLQEMYENREELFPDYEGYINEKLRDPEAQKRYHEIINTVLNQI
ncbi:hypothetical protein HN903_03655 [archaeon]|jgi:hypothetical protein|nr:hypothetical protein [archaeon]MBT7128825.1 hypothetical protein [archaeon]